MNSATVTGESEQRLAIYPVAREEILAIEQFFRRCTLPIFSDESGGELIGTGTFFNVAGRQFLITASHIFDDVDEPASIAVPDSPTRGELRSIGKATIARPQVREIDVAVVELHSNDTIEMMRVDWTPLNLDSVRAPYREGVFILAGYPVQIASNDDAQVQGTMATIFSELMESSPPDAAQPIDETLDLFFHYDRTGIAFDGQEIDSVHLGGASGSTLTFESLVGFPGASARASLRHAHWHFH